MKRLTLLLVAGLAVAAAPGWAAGPRAIVVTPAVESPPGLVEAAHRAFAALEPTPDDEQASAEKKAVSRKDKLVADITGAAVAGTVYSGGECGWRTEDIVTIWVQAKGITVAVICHPSVASACLSLRQNQRVRMQGALVAAPDVLAPGFEPCDPSTWYLGPINFFFATKVTK